MKAIGLQTAGLRIYRAAVFVGVILMMHRGEPPVDPSQAAGVSMEDLREFFPAAAGVGERTSEDGAHLVLDSARKKLGFVVTTSPDADHIVGYSGPNNVLLAFGQDGRVLGMKVLKSGDTPEHLEQVEADGEFMATFDGYSWTEVQSTRQVDGVSGATLTSLAIAEGVIQRVAGYPPSLRFPDRLDLEDARRIFPEAVEQDGGTVFGPGGGQVYGKGGVLLGRLLRSSPHSDNLIGYGGPTDLLVGVTGDDDTIVGIAIGETYDTEKYVGWVEQEAGFIEMFNGKTLAEMAQFDPVENGVEGVSGATMTSMNVTYALIELAEADVAEDVVQLPVASIFQWLGWRDLGTALVICFGLVMAFTRLRGVRKVRIAFQLILIGYLGLINGDLISQALLAGWAQNGTAWRYAPSLVLLVLVALLVPLVTKKQVYCHQLCPHGAAQQLVKNWLPKRLRLKIPRRLAIALRVIPFLLLLLVIAVGVRQLAFNLVSIEPFDAYLFQVAGWATVSIAGFGLVASLFVPMAYCRYGCPTGAMINFLWGSGKPGKFSRRDWLALVCLSLAVGLRVTS